MCIMQSKCVCAHRARMINRQSAFDWFDFDYFLQRPRTNVQLFAPQQSTYLLCVHLSRSHICLLHCRYLLMEISILQIKTNKSMSQLHSAHTLFFGVREDAFLQQFEMHFQMNRTARKYFLFFIRANFDCMFTF